MNVPAICSDVWFMVPRLPHTPHADLIHAEMDVAQLKKLLGIRSTELVNGVAVIPVDGVLASGVSMLDELFGFTGYERVLKDVREAIENPDVRGLVLSINSPGGQASGMIETASAIAEATKQKQIIAHTATLAASAAHGLARGATTFYATPSAIVGSIGTYMAITDMSRMAEAMGIKVNLIASGPFKGAGMPGTEVTKEQLAQFQTVVDELAGQFKAFELSRAPHTKEEAMQGQAVTGSQSIALGLADSLASLDEAIADAQS
jgi:signal peptide peptidase SppA